jgi:RNA polymerase sigma-70 factor (TIGR02957 family)
MDTASLTFNGLRPRLRGIAYRMLGSLAEAEEVVQDAWLRWHEADYVARDDPTGWLVTVTTRLSINRLRAAKVQREHYVGLWLPEPVLTDSPDSPEQMLERADDVSVAFLLMLERLTPEARAAFLLREVFDADYDELASTIGKSEAACRQLVHRARVQLREERPRFEVSPDTHRRLLGRFAQALTGGDFSALKALLAEDAELIGDGGGKVSSLGRPMIGGQRIAQLFFAAKLRLKDELRIELALINGEWGLLRFFNGVLESAQSYETDGERIVRIHLQRNPEKLVRVAKAFGGC